MGCHAPKDSRGCSEAVFFEDCGSAFQTVTDKDELPQIGDQHLAIACEIARDLRAQSHFFGVFGGTFHLDRSARRELAFFTSWLDFLSNWSAVKSPPSGRPAPLFLICRMQRTRGLSILPCSLRSASSAP